MSKIENTLLIIKPDSVEANNIGKIISILEENKMKIVYIFMLKLDFQTAKDFYKDHENKSFYLELVNFIISGYVVLVILQGVNIIKNLRVLIGDTNFKKAKDNTIRKLFATSITKNSVHASDSLISFEKEKKILFNYIEKCNQNLTIGK